MCVCVCVGNARDENVWSHRGIGKEVGGGWGETERWRRIDKVGNRINEEARKGERKQPCNGRRGLSGWPSIHFPCIHPYSLKQEDLT